MGHLAVMDDSEAQFVLTSFSQCLWRELAPELPGRRISSLRLPLDRG